MLRHLIRILVGIAALGTAATAQAEAAYRIPPLLAAVKQAFHLESNKTDPLTPLAEFLSASKEPGALPDLAWKLSVALNQADLPRLVTSLSAGVQIGSEYGDVGVPDWRFGTVADRQVVADYLWTQARHANDPARRKTLGAAALVLIATEGYTVGNRHIDQMIDDIRSGKIPILAGADLERLVSAVTSARQQLGDFAKSMAVARNSIYRAAENKGPIPEERITRIIADLSEARQHTVDGFQQFRIVTLAWLLRNLARQQDDMKTARAVEEFLGDWKATAKDSPTEKWITEAMTKDGPPPRPAVRQR